MNTAAWPFDNSYAALPEHFYTRQAPTPVAAPGPVRVNRALATTLGLDPDWLASPAGTRVLAGNEVPPGAAPLAAVYAGHQFGSYNPQLGDGRAILLGEVIDRAGERFDIQLKGAGRTPYSRGGDGRAPLGPVLREYVVSEAMATLGVPTSRALAAVTTGETVYRDRPLPGAVLTRVARSHIRIGTFEFFAARRDTDALRALADHVIARHYPALRDAANPPLALLQGAVERQAALVSQWQLLGFIHGVMNTDNMLLSGETIDYGPCAFMDAFHPDTVFSSIDHGGRYAYRNQPAIAHWNLAVLAQSLLPLLHDDPEEAVKLAQGAVDTFPDHFLAAHQRGLNRKLGLTEAREGDRELAEELFELMAGERVDFTLFFRRLADFAAPDSAAATVEDLFPMPARFLPWMQRWQARCGQESTGAGERQAAMYRANPAFIPRNHLVEEAIAAAVDNGDFTPFHALVERLAAPFDYDPADRRLALPPTPEQMVHQTFCGT
ncbi:YdiU family protein [Parahaliea mediterranea]|uniref:Protein nucleotidyltransferase YdiU n=2 Tax=Parahaliea mediterranea TaxID=651086 RepID=A0A939ILZ2_9GAMM|nr:YdiU family protein [Parahaliea mediterranea]MBN7796472.1 YdiU family protein [Parahaliea mediterranea]